MNRPIRNLVNLALALVFCMILSSPLLAAPAVILDNQELSFDVPPVIENGRTLVQLRTIFELLGAEVRWEAPTQSVYITKDRIHIQLIIDNPTAYLNGNPIPLSVPPKTIDGRTMVPLRFVSETLGAQVKWDEQTETITILTAPAL